MYIRGFLFGSSGLAFRAKMRGAPAQHNPHNRRAADGARFSFAIVDAVNFLEIAGPAVGVAVVSKGAAATADGLVEDGFDASAEAGDLRRGKFVRRDSGIDAGAEKRFVRIDVSQSREHFLIEQRGFDGSSGF